MNIATALLGILWCGAALAQQPAASAKAEEKKGGSIEGTVVNAITGQALKNVNVVLLKPTGLGERASAVTDEAGRYRFGDLPAGDYGLLAERSGYAQQAYGSRSRNPYLGSRIPLAAGQELKELVFKLMPGGTIAGKVVDEEGEPVATAIVLCLRHAYRHGKRELLPVGTATSNDAGDFAIAKLAAGEYYLVAGPAPIVPGLALAATPEKASPAKPERAFVPTYYPNSPDAGGAAPIALSAGAELRGMDIRMVKSSAVRVSGKVLGAAPETQMVMVVLTVRGGSLAAQALRRIAMARPPEFSFELAGVAPGSYTLSAAAVDKPLVPECVLALEVADQAISNVQLAFGGSAELAGTVEGEGKAAKVKDAQILLEAQEAMVQMPPTAAADENGRFTLKSLWPNRYTVHATRLPDGAYVREVRWNGRAVKDQVLEMSQGVSGTIQVLLATDSGQVSGTVQDAEGKPVQGALVALIPKSKQRTRYRPGTTDAQGQFQMKTVPPGEYQVLAWEDIEPSAYEDPEFVRQYSSQAESLEVKEGSTANLRLKVIRAGEK